MNTILRTLLLLSALAHALTSHAQLNYMASEIVLGDWPDDVLRADMDGDGRKDLIVPRWSADAGRELLIYLQQDDGRFPSLPSRYVEIKPEIIAFSIADIRPDPGAELLLFSSTHIYSLASAIPSYTDNLEQLAEWELLASTPDRRRVHHIPASISNNADQASYLLVPGRHAYGYFRAASDGTFSQLHEFNTVNEALDPSEIPLGSGRLNTQFRINERDGIVLNVSARSNSAFEDFLFQWTGETPGDLLQTRHWVPSAVQANMDADNLEDLVFLNIGNDLYGQVNIQRQISADTFSQTPDWQGPIDTRGDIRLLDVNGDGMADILRIIDNSNEWDVHFHLNQGGYFNFHQPDQIMRFSGYDVTVSVTDLNADGRPQLSVNYYTIPVVNAVRNASIVRSQLLFSPAAGEGQVFNPRPDFKLDENFSADAVRGLSSQIHLQTDLDGDGRKDAIYLSNDGSLAAKAIGQNLRFADTPFWQYVPTRSILQFDIEDMNGDGTPDLILYHSTAMTVLVSTP
jgi:hypothetical protein